jgi:hypothetical protein
VNDPEAIVGTPTGQATDPAGVRVKLAPLVVALATPPVGLAVEYPVALDVLVLVSTPYPFVPPVVPLLMFWT